MTAIFGIITFLAVLGPLIILHELGHLFAARISGTKVVEFGFGFPPRAWGFWTGRTRVRLTPETTFEDNEPLTVGKTISVLVRIGEDGIAIASRFVTSPYKEKDGNNSDRVLISGKLRLVENGNLFISEMLWSFNFLPLGGFVKMVGEEDPSAEGSLASKSRITRIFVLASGSLVNAILPFVIFAMVAMVPQDKFVGQVLISAVMPDSPAEDANLREGDVIVKTDGRLVENIPDLQRAVTMRLGQTMRWEIKRAIPDPHPVAGGPKYQYLPETQTIEINPRWKPPNRTIVQVVTDPNTQIALRQARLVEPLAGLSNQLSVVNQVNDELREISLVDATRFGAETRLGNILTVVPMVSDMATQISVLNAREHHPDIGAISSIQEGAAGITIALDNGDIKRRWNTPFGALKASASQVRDMIVLTKNGLTGLAVGSGNPQFEGPATVGPIGIGQLTGEIATSDADITSRLVTLANLAATLSFTLAVINMLPIPALDGGRILFVVIEFFRRGKRIAPRREGLVHLAGMVVLLTLIAIISMQDILRIARGESFF